MEDIVNVRKTGDRYEITPRSEWDPDASTVVAAGVARTEDLPPGAITPPLPAFVDPDALNAFVSESEDEDVCVQFSAWGYLITIGADFTVLLRPLPDSEQVSEETADHRPGEPGRSHS